MASPNSSWSDILTTTLYSRTKKLADNMSDNTAILMRMKEKGRIRTVSGGEAILQELEYAENTNAMWYSGYEQLAIAPQELFSAAEYAWKQAAVAVTIAMAICVTVAIVSWRCRRDTGSTHQDTERCD